MLELAALLVGRYLQANIVCLVNPLSQAFGIAEFDLSYTQMFCEASRSMAKICK